MSIPATSTPAQLNATAAARPIPRAAPVPTAIRPASGESDDMVGVHFGDGVRVVAEFGEDVVGVFAEER